MTMPRVVFGIEYRFIQVLIVINLFLIGFRKYRNIGNALIALKQLLKFSEKLKGSTKINKAFYNQGEYTWSMFHPGWPSPAFDKYFETVLESFIPKTNSGSIRRLLIAITKKCPLACEHCSEWDTLYSNDALSLDEWKTLLDEWVSCGVGQLVYSGGEPLMRFKDLMSLTKQYKGRVDQWIYTSGYGLTLEKARLLRQAGLNGVAISIDNHDQESHNHFRNNNKSFQLAIDAVHNCKKVGLITALNICPTKDYINSGGLNHYLKFASELGVAYVTLLEPRAIGHYYGKDVEYTTKEWVLIDKFYNYVNSLPGKSKHPLFFYTGLTRKQNYCGGGLSYIFIDYDGSTHNCPFCKVPWAKNKLLSDCTAGKLDNLKIFKTGMYSSLPDNKLSTA